MINVLLCSIRDRKTEHFNMPFTIESEVSAQTYFIYGLKSEEVKYKEDLELYKLGTMDIETGMITQDKIPELLMTGNEALKILEFMEKEEDEKKNE